MLQIATGKLFTRPAGRENLLRGMLYTNAILAREEVVETAAGRLFPSSSYSIRPTEADDRAAWIGYKGRPSNACPLILRWRDLVQAR